MTIKHLLGASLLALTITLSACQSGDETNVVETAQLGSYGIATDLMDVSVKPGDNFFKYVNGTWLKKTEIPAD